MTQFMRKPAAGSRRTAALLAAAAGAALWGAAMAAQAADQPTSPQPAPAQAADQPALPQPAPAHNGAVASSKSDKPDPQERVICREEEETGSRLGGKRICHTKRDWDRIENDAEDYLTDKRPH